MMKTDSLRLWRSLIYSLVLFGRIKISLVRSRAIKGMIDKLVNKIKKGTVAARRDVLRTLPRKEIVDKLVADIVPRLAGRSSGYTRVVKIGQRRGDGTSMVIMEWITEETVLSEKEKEKNVKIDKAK